MHLRKFYKTIAVLALVFGLSGCDPFHTGFQNIEPAKKYTLSSNATSSVPAKLKVMTYNIKFGGGRIDMFFDCHGDREIMSEEEVKANLDAVVAFINTQNPDILFLQEVDVASKRSANIDELKYIQERTNLKYGLYASQWKSDFVPSHNLGNVDTGNAILSRFELKDGLRYAYPPREDIDFITRYFYLKRGILEAKVYIGSKELVLLNTHIEAYTKDDTKKKQLQIFHKKVKEWSNNGFAVIAGGDFNTLPPYTQKLKGFDDSVCKDEFDGDDHSMETGWNQPFYDSFVSAIPLEDYKANNSKYFGFTSKKDGYWNRTLDYLFTNQHFANGLVIQEGTMHLSDHAPMVVDFEFRQ